MGGSFGALTVFLVAATPEASSNSTSQPTYLLTRVDHGYRTKPTPHPLQPQPWRTMHASAATIARRWRLVHEAERLGSCRAAAKALGADVRTVIKLVKRAKDTGSVDDLPRSGRPRAPLGTREAEEKLREGIRAGLKCPQLAQKPKDEVEGLSVTAETVRRHVAAYLARQLRQRKRVYLTPRHMQDRLTGVRS